jgi:hypothetical protein
MAFTAADEDIDSVREIAGELSFTYVSTLVDSLNDAQWNRALDLITAWVEFAPGSVLRLEGGREGVFDSDQAALLDIRIRMRNLLGLPDYRDAGLTGGFGTTSVPVLWVW